MKSFKTTVLISSAPERVWALLTDGGRYPEWNSTVTGISGRIASGEKITVHATMNPGRAFPLKVAITEPGREMRWSGGMPFGLFRGVRKFTLRPEEDGRVEFCMREEYTGLIAPLILRSIPNLQPSFEQFGEDLKRAAEREASFL